VHGHPATVQSRSDEHDRIPVDTSLSPIMARVVADRRAARPRHLAGDAADRYEPAHRAATTRVVGAVGVVLLLVAVGAMIALWPQASSDDGGLEASGVTTTEPTFSDTTEPAATTRSDVAGSEGTGTGSEGTSGSTDTTSGTSSTTGGSTSTTWGNGRVSGGGTVPGPPGTTSPAPSTTAPPARSGATTTTAPSSTTTTLGDPRVDATWDVLAQCESGGDWSLDTGNGRYGGLQIDVHTWREYGGRGFPDQQSRETQITVARRIQAGEGWDYWSSCATRLGYI
jgi:hypothetical protein